MDNESLDLDVAGKFIELSTLLRHMVVQQTALLAIVREKLSISDEEWDREMSKASSEVGFPPSGAPYTNPLSVVEGIVQKLLKT